jgi:hypothetical protein
MASPLFKKSIFFVLVISGLMLAFAGCQKSERDEDTETTATRDNALAYHIFDDAFRVVHRFAMRDSLLNDTGIVQWFDDCIVKATLSDTLAIFPLYLSVNYSDDTTLCDDGFNRYGLIRASFSGKYLNQGTQVAISFEGYRKDAFDVSGNILLTNKGLNSDGRRVFSVQVTDGIITGRNIDIEWQGTHDMVWVAGSSTDGIVDDDIFEISGSASGKNSRGNTFVNAITESYSSDLSCQWFKSGRSEVYVPNLQTRLISYGIDGVCDNIFVQSRDNTTMQVEIPYTN